MSADFAVAVADETLQNSLADCAARPIAPDSAAAGSLLHAEAGDATALLAVEQHAVIAAACPTYGLLLLLLLYQFA